MRYSPEANAHKSFAKGCGGHADGMTTNPPVSKAQGRFMRSVASGKIKRPGLSKSKAKEFVADQPRGLPERVKR
jgi:hypothetical protein